VDDEAKQGSPRCTTRRDEKQRRLQLVSFLMNGLLLQGDKLVESLELLIAPGDRIALEGDNQKQTDS
jgi:malonate decarboxylase alpha subunit